MTRHIVELDVEQFPTNEAELLAWAEKLALALKTAMVRPPVGVTIFRRVLQ